MLGCGLKVETLPSQKNKKVMNNKTNGFNKAVAEFEMKKPLSLLLESILDSSHTYTLDYLPQRGGPGFKGTIIKKGVFSVFLRPKIVFYVTKSQDRYNFSIEEPESKEYADLAKELEIAFSKELKDTSSLYSRVFKTFEWKVTNGAIKNYGFTKEFPRKKIC